MPCCLVGFAPPPAALHLLRHRMASASSCAFQLCLNPLTGDSEWLVIEEAEGEEEGEAPQPPHRLRPCKTFPGNARTLLDSMLSEDAFIIPCKGILKFCAMSLPDLWRSRCSLKDVEGFDHSVVNETLGACGDLPGEQQGPCLPYYVWQCGYTKKLSKVYSLMDFNFSERIHSCFGKTKIEFADDGICHGFAVWIDWVLDEKKSVVLNTGPDNRYWKQGVQLLSKPVQVNPAKSAVHVEASFDPATGELTFNSSLS